jgi:hypothetical protein
MRAARLTLIAVVAASLAGPALASAITDSLLSDRLVGAWAEGGDCSRGGLSFKDDGTFTVTGDYADTDIAGTFDVKDGRLVGKAGDRIMPLLPILFSDDGWLLLGPDMFERCKAPPPAPSPSRP